MATNILILEDEAHIQQTLRFVLEHAGYSVSTAGNGLEGLEQIEKAIPDLIICDLMMPEMSGAEFISELEQRGLRSSIPIILLTAVPHIDEFRNLIGLGPIVHKPFEIPMLLNRVAEIVQEPRPPLLNVSQQTGVSPARPKPESL